MNNSKIILESARGCGKVSSFVGPVERVKMNCLIFGYSGSGANHPDFNPFHQSRDSFPHSGQSRGFESRRTHGCPTVIHIGRLRAVCLAGGLSLVFTTGKRSGTDRKWMGHGLGTLSAACRIRAMPATPVTFPGNAALMEQKLAARDLFNPSLAGGKRHADNGTSSLSIVDALGFKSYVFYHHPLGCV